MPTSSAGTFSSASGVIVTMVSVLTEPAAKTSVDSSLLKVFFVFAETVPERLLARGPVAGVAAASCWVKNTVVVTVSPFG